MNASMWTKWLATCRQLKKLKLSNKNGKKSGIHQMAPDLKGLPEVKKRKNVGEAANPRPPTPRPWPDRLHPKPEGLTLLGQ